MGELKNAYISDRTFFNSINKYVQGIMSGEHEIYAKDKKVQKHFNGFAENLGNSGTELTWDDWWTNLFVDAGVFGKSFTELIPNKRGNSIVDLDHVDAEYIDYAKDTNNNVSVDKYQKNIGYFQIIPYGYPITSSKDRNTLPPGIMPPTGGGSWTYIPRERLSQVKLYTIGDGFYPIGLIEPAYQCGVRKLNMENAMSNAFWRFGFPIMQAQMGDINHQPNPQQIKDMLDKMKDINSNRGISMPWYNKLSVIEPSNTLTNMQEPLIYFENQQITAAGIPKSFATSSPGDAESFASLEFKSYFFKLALMDMVNRVVSGVRQTVFRPICRLEGFKEVPTMKWNITSLDHLEKKAKRLAQYVRSGALTSDPALQENIKRSEGLLP